MDRKRILGKEPPRKVFLSGIAGTGMSALAGLFRQHGCAVYGSDAHFYPPADRILAQMDVKIFCGFKAENIPSAVDLCVIGNVIARGNPEAEYILNSGVEYLSMPEALYRYFIHGKTSVVVAGTHGKTTIASFVAHLLNSAGWQPGFFIGGQPLDFPANSRLAAGDHFVSEGDEYESAFFDRSAKFLKYRPQLLILTGLEHDHLDVFPNPDLYRKSFSNLVQQVPAKGLIISNHDFPMNRQVLTKAFTPVLSYGAEEADFRIAAIAKEEDGYSFILQNGPRQWNFHTSLSGRYNVWNLTAGIVLGFHLGLDEQVVQRAVGSFHGVARRLNTLRNLGQTVFVEDFAHHPTAIRQALDSVREGFPGKHIIAAFEPRSWSLRRNFFQEQLPASFAAADQVLLLAVYEGQKIPVTERLDIERLKGDLQVQGKEAQIFADYDALRQYLPRLDFERSQVVVLLSNGGLGGIPEFIRSSLGGS